MNEITFGETGSGAAMVQGSYVGQGSRECFFLLVERIDLIQNGCIGGARMGGPFGNRGSMESREQTMMNGSPLASLLSISFHSSNPDYHS